MNFPRLALWALPLTLGLPLLTGACGAPLSVSAASYGADGASMVETGKTATDHFVSMVSKKDCALWRVFRNQSICRQQEGDPNPYNVDYNAPFRQGGEGGVEYMSPPHAAADAPAASWNDTAYNVAPASPVTTAVPNPAAPVSTPVQAAALTVETTPISAVAAPAKTKKKQPARGHSVIGRKLAKKKPSQDPAATVP
jgi:hypothetical protein